MAVGSQTGQKVIKTPPQKISWVWSYMPIILATQKAIHKRISVSGKLCQKYKTLSEKKTEVKQSCGPNQA
jgi:hypothetical protein